MAITAILPARTTYFKDIVSEIQSLSTTDDPLGITQYDFDFGDGNVVSSTTDTVWHRYLAVGSSITLTLTVTNSLSETSTTSSVISIIDPIIDTSRQLRRYITQFMDVFNGMTIVNKDDTTVSVPLVYGSNDRVVSYIRGEDASGNSRTSIALPLMSAKLTEIDLRTEANAGTHQKRFMIDSNNDSHSFVKPTPVSLAFNLGIWAYDYGQAFSMLETIVPWFNPDLILNVGDLDHTSQNPLILESVSDQTEMDLGTAERTIKYDLEFSLKGYLPRNRQITDKVTSTFLDVTLS